MTVAQGSDPNAPDNADLFQRMIRSDTLDAAWTKVRANAGCAGGDGETVEGFVRRAPRRLVLLARALERGEYRPRDIRLLHIPKPSGGSRPLAIPSVEDRIAQTACAAVLTPVLDPTFDEASFAYRPGRSVIQAVRAIERWRKRGYTHVVEADIVRCFERIPQAPLLGRLEAVLAGQEGATRIVDLVALWLEQAALVLETPGIGLPQGSPLSPLLANLYLDGVDEGLAMSGVRLVRFADDFVLLCKNMALAERALGRAEAVLGEHGLELHADRTRIVDFDQGFEFLGHLFVRSMALKRVSDPEEDALDTLRSIAKTDAADQRARSDRAEAEAAERARGYDRGARVLHLAGHDRRLGLRNLSFSVTRGDGSEIIAVGHQRVDRIELATDADADVEALRLALGSGTDVAFLNGQGETLGWLAPPGEADRAQLQLAQARTVLDPELATALARILVAGRLHNQRSQLHRLNRAAKDEEVILAAKTLGRTIRKLPHAADIDGLRGHEGAAAAVYWPALGRLAAEASQPFRRSRPATDPLNATINYLAALLARDIRAAVQRSGLHPGFGVLHAVADRNEACVWDLIEAFRAPLSEGLAVTLFNQGRLKAAMFTASSENGVRIGADARKAIIHGYEQATGRLVKSPHSGRRRTWRVLMQEEAGAFGRHCPSRGAEVFRPYRLDHRRAGSRAPGRKSNQCRASISRKRSREPGRDAGGLLLRRVPGSSPAQDREDAGSRGDPGSVFGL